MTYRTRDRRIYRRNDFPATSPNRRTRTSAPPIARNRAAQTEAAPVAEPQPIEASQSTRLGELQTQVQARKTDAEQKQTAAKNAYQQYVSFLDQPSDPTYSILDDNGAASAAAEQTRKTLWTSYQQADEAAKEAQTLYESALETYNQRIATAERDGYFTMDLGDLKTQLDTQTQIVKTKRTSAAIAQNNYNAFLDQPATGNFLEEDMTASSALQAQQQALLQASKDATDALYDAIETQKLMEDVYHERNDMQIISGMTDTEKIALEIYKNGINIFQTTKFINDLPAEQRAKLRNTGKMFEILTDPKKYLRNAGYAEDDLPRIKETYSRYLNAQNMQQLQKNAEAFAQEYPVLSTAISYPMSAIGDVYGGAMAMGSTILHDMGLYNYNSIDVNAPAYMPSVYTDVARSSVAEDLGDAGGTIYQGFNNVIDDSIRDFTLGKKGAMAVNALGDFGSSAREAAIRGGTNQEAFFTGASNAGLSLLMDAIPIVKLFEIDSSHKWKPVLDAGISFSEGLVDDNLQNVGDLTAQNVFLHEKSSFNAQTAALIQAGLTEDEARREAFRSVLARRRK